MPRRLAMIMAGLAGLVLVAVLVWRASAPGEAPATDETPREEAAAPPAAADVDPEPEAPRERVPRAARDPAPRAEPEPEAPPAARRELRVESDVPGAFVFLGRKYLGTTPFRTTDIAPGTHEIRVSADGYDSVTRQVEIADAPVTMDVKLKEVRLDAAVDVVHRHGMGSCEGRLVATPDGLRYETSNTGDAFALPFAQVETFEIDYLKKNLRVKQRGGKTWNFTTRADSADPLLVFHREVEAARKKLTIDD